MAEAITSKVHASVAYGVSLFAWLSDTEAADISSPAPLYRGINKQRSMGFEVLEAASRILGHAADLR